MIEFTYNNAKNASTCYTLLKLDYKYYFYVFFNKDINPQFKFKATNKLLIKLLKLILVCYNNLFHTQKLQKQAYNKRLKANKLYI